MTVAHSSCSRPKSEPNRRRPRQRAPRGRNVAVEGLPLFRKGPNNFGSFGLISLVRLPLTTKTIMLVGSYYKALYRNRGKPTKMMVLVVEGTVSDPRPLCYSGHASVIPGQSSNSWLRSFRAATKVIEIDLWQGFLIVRSHQMMPIQIVEASGNDVTSKLGCQADRESTPAPSNYRGSHQLMEDSNQAWVPAPPKYPLRHAKYHLMETIRALKRGTLGGAARGSRLTELIPRPSWEARQGGPGLKGADGCLSHEGGYQRRLFYRLQKVGLWAWDALWWCCFCFRLWGLKDGDIPTF